MKTVILSTGDKAA